MSRISASKRTWTSSPVLGRRSGRSAGAVTLTRRSHPAVGLIHVAMLLMSRHAEVGIEQLALDLLGRGLQVDQADPGISQGVHPRTVRFRSHAVGDSGPVLLSDLDAVLRRLTATTGQDEPSNPVDDPPALLHRPVADPTVARDHAESLFAHDVQPLVIGSPSRNLREIWMSGEHDPVMPFRQGSAQSKVVLVYEELRCHSASGRDRTLLLLVGHRGANFVVRHVVAG